MLGRMKFWWVGFEALILNFIVLGQRENIVRMIKYPYNNFLKFFKNKGANLYYWIDRGLYFVAYIINTK